VLFAAKRTLGRHESACDSIAVHMEDDDAAKALAAKVELRALNSACERPNDAALKARDSSLKKYAGA
jgi:hypothetical protein